MDRLRNKQPRLLEAGSAVECAERLLLSEQDVLSAASLLSRMSSNGVSSVKEALSSRLKAVGLPSHGIPLEQARRLLLLRNMTAHAVLEAGILGGANFRWLPQGQGDLVCMPIPNATAERYTDDPIVMFATFSENCCSRKSSQLARSMSHNASKLGLTTAAKEHARRQVRDRRTYGFNHQAARNEKCQVDEPSWEIVDSSSGHSPSSR